jgi:CDP-glucose 4,6-dehydratase
MDSIFNQADVKSVLDRDIRLDIRDKDLLTAAVREIDPEVVIHLAAQPLVRYSYKFPVETFQTNVIGTLNLLEATKNLDSLRASLVVTTDKVYKNFGHFDGYVESDPLGGEDPYSASKAAADLASQSWISSFGVSKVAIARAGNVIGGGDWAQDRLIPDLVRAYENQESPLIRNPNSIRPWQHVLDCLNGYLLLINSMLKDGTAGEWNFGPDHRERHTVSEVIESFAKNYGVEVAPWTQDKNPNPPEAGFLLLNSTKSRTLLDWKDLLTFEESLAWTANWYRQWQKIGAREATLAQIREFERLNTLNK